eukprot:TRINITY_DN4192_c0_g2_i1.p1 TRINITY_DN4192_c0_g2~~TRINITY_DN4192_c0_g2_i1.p1  ORF type:complete len:775 (-),score=157.05 TRINITY_DN4192_c0_g2_i1:26-2350(-)
MTTTRVGGRLLWAVCLFFIVCHFGDNSPSHNQASMLQGVSALDLTHTVMDNLSIGDSLPRSTRSASSDTQTPQISTKSGNLRGYSVDGVADYYLGIPYAAPPTGNNRFRPPQAPYSWQGDLSANKYGSICMQGAYPIPNPDMSEDCLFLNVVTPPNAQSLSTGNDLLPVMVWIYGGSFIHGASDMFDATPLVQQSMEVSQNLNSNKKERGVEGGGGGGGRGGGAIVVTLNYRLGALGFLALDELAQEDKGMPTTGFYGLQDQRAAFQWVQDNIAQFGGDPDKVTIFGESAGAISVCAHLALPKSKGLFSAALLESSFCSLLDYGDALDLGDTLVSKLNCDNSDPEKMLACMRSASSNDVLTAFASDGSGGTPSNPLMPSPPFFFPALDPYELPNGMQPIDLIRRGNYNKIDALLLGSNLDEGSFFVCTFAAAGLPKASLDKWVDNQFPGKSGAIKSMYPASGSLTTVDQVINIASDELFKCGTKSLADAVSSTSSIPTYMYSFEHWPAWLDVETGPLYPYRDCIGVAHSYELPFVFPAYTPLAAGFAYTLDTDEAKLSSFMLSSWTSFAMYRDPNKWMPSGTYTKWPRYDSGSPYLVLDWKDGSKMKTGSDFRTKYCDLWEGLGDDGFYPPNAFSVAKRSIESGRSSSSSRSDSSSSSRSSGLWGDDQSDTSSSDTSTRSSTWRTSSMTSSYLRSSMLKSRPNYVGMVVVLMFITVVASIGILSVFVYANRKRPEGSHHASLEPRMGLVQAAAPDDVELGVGRGAGLNYVAMSD